MQHQKNTDTNLQSGKKIAYIIGTYPNLTTTFIDRELLEAKRLGLNMVVVAIRKSKFGSFSNAIMKMMEEVIYLLPVSISRLSGAHLYFAMRHFRKYVGTLIYLLTREHPTLKSRVKTLLHFGEGVLAAALLRNEKIKHVHAHFADRAAVIAMVISRLLEVPYSITAHAVDIYVAPSFLKEKIANAKFTTTCTAFNKAHIEKETGHPIELMYHGLDFADIQENPVAADVQAPTYILSVGQLKEKKGFPYLINACANLKKRGYKFICEIVGEGPDRAQLSTLIRELDLDDVVTLCGALPNAEVMQKYSKASMFVLACVVAENADRDGIPNVILEAMAHRLPVISTNVSGVPEVVHNTKTGLLVEPRSVEAISEAMVYLLDHPQEAREMGTNAMAFVKEEFNIRQNVGRLIELLME